jgi:cyclopropane fatty-acyl-phospholipid synthase-like methyltransferase
MEFWHKEFIYAQDRISDLPGNDFYAKEYRYHEPWYSKPIIQWLFEDSVHDGGKTKNVLDIGCGWGTMGYYIGKLYEAKIYCVDMLPKKLPFENMLFKEMNVEYDSLPFRWPFYYEKIIMTEVLEHLNCSPIPTLKKIRNWLADDGEFYLSTPNACDPLWGRITKHYNHIGEMGDPQSGFKASTDEHIYQYTEGELLYIFDKAGFEVVKKEIFKPPFWGEHINFKLKKNRLD